MLATQEQCRHREEFTVKTLLQYLVHSGLHGVELDSKLHTATGLLSKTKLGVMHTGQI